MDIWIGYLKNSRRMNKNKELQERKEIISLTIRVLKRKCQFWPCQINIPCLKHEKSGSDISTALQVLVSSWPP